MTDDSADKYSQTIDDYRKHLERERDERRAFVDRESPGWETATQDDDLPDYLWNGQRVEYLSSIRSDGVPMAWVRLASGDVVMAPVSELKPIRGGR